MSKIFREGLDFIRKNKSLFEDKIISKYTNKNWLKSALRKDNFEGPNGNKVVSYIWPWKWDIREIGDEVKDVRVSDWDRAEICSTCNRKIVHIFYVWHKDDKSITPYGFDHVHKALGITKELSKSMITKIKNSVTIPKDQKSLSSVDEKRIKIVLNAYRKTSADTVTDAMEKMSMTYGFRQSFDYPLFYHKNERKYLFLAGKKITNALLKRVEKLIPEFEYIPKEKVYNLHAKDRIKKLIKHYARSSTRDAVKAASGIKRSENNIWAANLKKDLIMIIPKGSLIDHPTFIKNFPRWEVGGPELAKKFRANINKKLFGGS
jgi:hypothetical protein